MKNLFEAEKNCFSHPCSMIVSGMSQSGKTSFVKKLIENKQLLFFPVPQKIMISFAEYQPIYDDLKGLNNTHFIEGFEFDLTNKEIPKLIVIDDQMTSTATSKHIQELFTKGIHHQNVSVILIQQNCFNQGRFARDIRLNTHYWIIFKSPTFASQINYIGRQLFPRHPTFVESSYEDATKTKYSYLFINLHPSCEDELRVQAGILPGENHVIYSPK